jgi:hypothetical protein
MRKNQRDPGRHTDWCETSEHDARAAATGEWQGCAGDPACIIVAGTTFTANLYELSPGRVSVVVEASRDGRVIPASLILDAADAARVCAWAASVLASAGCAVAAPVASPVSAVLA